MTGHPRHHSHALTIGLAAATDLNPTFLVVDLIIRISLNGTLHVPRCGTQNRRPRVERLSIAHLMVQELMLNPFPHHVE